MSLCIDIDVVREVMIGGQWFTVGKNHEGLSSFALDAYEFEHRGRAVHSGGNSGVCATGFAFSTPDNTVYFGPLTAIQAVSYGKPGG